MAFAWQETEEHAGGKGLHGKQQSHILDFQRSEETNPY